MKKSISIFLAVVMLLSVCSVMGMAFDEENPNPITGETQLKVAFNPLDKIHYTIIDEHADTGYYDKGDVCEFTAEVWGGYEKTNLFMLKVNTNYILPYKTEGDVMYYRFTVEQDSLVQAVDGSVVEHTKLGLFEWLIFWFQFIFNYLSNIITINV